MESQKNNKAAENCAVNETPSLHPRAGVRDGVSRTLAKLDKRIADGEYYEAHQLYRTLYFRYTSQQKYAEAIDLLMKGVLALLEAKQMSSGADLALLLVNTLEKHKIEVNVENIAKVTSLHRLLERNHIERPTFVVSAMRWSKQTPGVTEAAEGAMSKHVGTTHTHGHPVLHGRFAVTYWHERDYTQSRYHFVRSLDGEGCASMLVEYHVTQGYPGEVDLFIAQAVFQYLCLRNKITAEVCFNCYTKQHPQVEPGPPFIHPLLNFLWMLLLTVEGGNISIFTILCEQYHLSLIRDSSYHDYIARIGQIFFHVPPPKSNGLFGNLFSSFLTMEDDGDDERSLVEPGPEDLD
jgi:hypothetical protein